MTEPMGATATVIMTLRDESQDRVDRALAAARAQTIDGPYEIVVALAAADRERLRLPDEIVVADNPTGGRSRGLNAAATEATGTFVCRIDARSLPPVDSVARCVRRLQLHPEVGVVGAVQRPRPLASGVVAQGIARALANPWALGGAPYRRLEGSGPVDTVYLGAYRRDELLHIGGFDERLDANEDFELCQRYRDAGRAVWLEEGLVVDYEPRASVADLWQQYEAFGRAKVRYWRLTGERPNARQRAAITAGAAALVAAVGAARRPRRGALLAAAGIAGIAALDHVAGPAEGSLGVRAVATASYGVIVGGWLAGATREALLPRRTDG
jgi:succinoglycan biosynthesis protein ExoA